jgi:Flp pilus assembly protein TadG
MPGLGLYPGRHSRRAVVALEFALCLPMMLILLGGAADFGLAFYDRLNLASALEAGAEYAHFQGSSVTTGNITTVISNTLNLPSGSTLSVTYTPSSGPGYYCVTGSGSSASMTLSSSGATCADGTQAGLYLKIQASFSITGYLGAFSIPFSTPISDMVIVRIL